MSQYTNTMTLHGVLPVAGSFARTAGGSKGWVRPFVYPAQLPAVVTNKSGSLSTMSMPIMGMAISGNRAVVYGQPTLHAMR